MSERWRAPSCCNTSCQNCREPLLGLWGFALRVLVVDKHNWSRWFSNSQRLRNAHRRNWQRERLKKQVGIFFFPDSRKHTYVYLRGWTRVSGRTHTCGWFQSSRHVYPQSHALKIFGLATFVEAFEIQKGEALIASAFCVGFNLRLIRQEPQRSSDFKEAGGQGWK